MDLHKEPAGGLQSSSHPADQLLGAEIRSRIPDLEKLERLLVAAAVYPGASAELVSVKGVEPVRRPEQMTIFQTNLEAMLTGKLDALEVPIEERASILRVEKGFVAAVAEACHRWSPSSNAAVLWDIDHTTALRSEWRGGEVPTTLRLTMPEFIQALQEAYPNLRHGILSSKGPDHIRDLLEDEKALKPIAPLLTKAFVFSSRFRDCYHHDYPESVNETYYPKYDVLFGLGRLFSTEFKLVDDGFINDWLTPDQGLCIQKWNCSYLDDLIK